VYELEGTSKMETQLAVFNLANEDYGVDIGAVDGIVKMQAITRVPRAPGFVEGITNMRGEVLPVIDLRTRFGLPAGETTKETRIVNVEEVTASAQSLAAMAQQLQALVAQFKLSDNEDLASEASATMPQTIPVAALASIVSQEDNDKVVGTDLETAYFDDVGKAKAWLGST
jgi:hypothetical protein